MALKLSIENQVHHPGNSSEAKSAISEQGHRRVHFQPRIQRIRRTRARIVDQQADDGDGLEDKDERHAEHAEQRESKSTPQSEVENDDAPTDENENFGPVGDWAAKVQIPPLLEKETLKKQAGNSEPDVEFPRPVFACS